MSAFRLEDVSVHYARVPAVRDVTLSIDAGEQVAFVGPSGSGKTTLLRLLNGTVRPGSGRVLVDGRDLGTLAPGGLREVRAGIGFVHQDLSLVPNLRVTRNVLAGRLGRQSWLASLRSMLLPRRAELEVVHRILARVGIPEKLFERTDRLSGGQMQRVAIARALYQEPRALLADEPVSSVDPARAEDTVSLLAEISREAGLTLCMSLHNLGLAKKLFPRLVGLRHGRTVFDKPTAELTDLEFEDLYRLGRHEMLADGA